MMPLVWPTRLNPVAKMEFTTEEFVAAVIADAAKKHKLDPRAVFTLSWSSSGPAAYAIALQDKTPVTGSLVAMSVFKPDSLPPLAKAKGRPFYILHSPDDKVCPFRMAEAARDELTKAGAGASGVPTARPGTAPRRTAHRPAPRAHPRRSRGSP
jgi:predicted esterase